MRSFLDDWARSIRERNDGKIHTAPGMWMRTPVPKRYRDDARFVRDDQEGMEMAIIGRRSARCPDRDFALADGGAALKGYFSISEATCKKCEHRVQSRLHKRRYACGILREKAKDKPSAAQEIGAAITKANKEVKEMIGG